VPFAEKDIREHLVLAPKSPESLVPVLERVS